VSAADDVVPLIEAGEEHTAEVDRPDAEGGLLQADVVLREGVGDEEQPVLEAAGARRGV
jgi:hypothetical protein